MWSPGFDYQAGPGQAAVDQVRPVLDLLQLALDDADQAVQVSGGEVDHGPLQQRPDALCRVELGRGGAGARRAAASRAAQAREDDQGLGALVVGAAEPGALPTGTGITSIVLADLREPEAISQPPAD